MASAYGNDAAPLLLQAARRLEPFDLELARRAYLTAWGAAITAESSRGSGRPPRDLPRRPGAPTRCPAAPHPLDLLLEGLALLTTDGRAAATPILQRAAKAVLTVAGGGRPALGLARPGRQLRRMGLRRRASRSTNGQVQLVRDAGALGELPIHLTRLALERAWLGDFAGAGLLLAESDSVAAATGSQVPPFAVLRLRALQGREAEATPLIEATIQLGTAGGQGIAVMVAHWAAAVLYNGLARYEEAASAAREVTANAIDPWESMWALAELVEAAARIGDTELARDALNRLAETTQPAGTEFALGIEARCRALLSDGATAEELYRESIDRLSRTQLRPELARAHLLYGEWLRREGRRFDAREQLRTAHDMFVAIGMEAFAERARRELIATGEKMRKRSDRDARRAHAAGGADRPARPGRLVEPGDRRAALHQRAHGRMASGQGVHQARHQLPQGASGSPSRARRAPRETPSADAAPTRTRSRSSQSVGSSGIGSCGVVARRAIPPTEASHEAGSASTMVVPHLRDSARGRSQLPVRHSGGRLWLLKQVRAARHSSDVGVSAKRSTVC